MTTDEVELIAKSVEVLLGRMSKFDEMHYQFMHLSNRFSDRLDLFEQRIATRVDNFETNLHGLQPRISAIEDRRQVMRHQTTPRDFMYPLGVLATDGLPF